MNIFVRPDWWFKKFQNTQQSHSSFDEAIQKSESSRGISPPMAVKNRRVKTITRDRASAYAKEISEEVPDAMQIAVRFHLHHNLLDAVKGVLSGVVPATITIFHEHPETGTNSEADTGKKSHLMWITARVSIPMQ